MVIIAPNREPTFMAQQPSVGPFVDYLKSLQDSIVAALEAADGEATFLREEIATDGGGLSRPRVLADGPVIKKAAVQFTHSVGRPTPAATERHPHLAGRGFQAGAVSLIVHPRNYAPTTHMNIRMFVVDGAVDEPVRVVLWRWFRPYYYYGFDEDALHWHRTCAAALEGHGRGFILG